MGEGEGKGMLFLIKCYPLGDGAQEASRGRFSAPAGSQRLKPCTLFWGLRQALGDNGVDDDANGVM